MSPPNPKRPPRSPHPTPGDTTARSDDVELPFDDDEVAPLQADDPRPQRVPQFPVGSRRRGARGGAGASRESKDREMPPARFTSGEYEDAGHARAFLYVERGPGSGQLVPIQQGVLRLGRSSASDLRLQHPSISRRHAQLTRHGDRLLLKDLGSQNGTYVNRVRLHTERELFSGDEIAMGNALLRLRGPGPVPERPARAYSRKPSSLRVRMSNQRMLLLASATGALVAVFLMLPLMRVMRSMSAASQASAAHAEHPGFSEITESIEDVPPTPVRVAPPTQPTPQTAAPASDKGDAGREARRRTEAEVLTHYTQGRLDEALALARAGQLDTQAALLTRFQAEWTAGRTALEDGDFRAAVTHLTSALALDQEIARGKGVLARQVRTRLNEAQRSTP
ncbi:FHA domain-containing protein [Melittangium boletus]|uniref:FHA domain-containing protein n=1 Tax=Melittangium boletus TaxID=83453 RepID=UPI003DA5FFF2